MTAQERWKEEYKRFKHDLDLGWGSAAYGILDYAYSRYLREAALERIISRREREIDTLKAELELARTIFASVLGLNDK